MQFPAIVLSDAGKVEVREVAVSEPQPDEVLIRSEYSFISTDTERLIWAKQFRTHRYQSPPFPFVPGWQRVGIVEEVGEEVPDLQPGMRVFAPSGRFEGIVGFMGAHCQYGVTHHSHCIPVPVDVNPIAVSGLALVQAGYNAASRPWLEQGTVAVIIGDGLLGQWAAQWLYRRGASVIMAGSSELRLDRAEAYAGARGVGMSVEEIQGELAHLAPEGANVVVDALADTHSLSQAVQLARQGGQLVLPGLYPDGNQQIDISLLQHKELTIHGCFGWTRERLEDTLELIRRRQLEVEELITHLVAWEKADEVYRRLVWERDGEFLGIVIDWSL